MQVDACTGGCCAVFYFPRTPAEIRERIEDNGYYNGYDGMMIADMLIPLTTEEAEGRIERFGLNPAALSVDGALSTRLYTCRHWNEDTGACMVYDHRPGMCKTYPYGRECGHCKMVGGCEYGTSNAGS